MSATLRPHGLTHVQFVLLASTWWLTRVSDEAPTQSRVAEHAGTDPMMTSQVLRALEAKGLVVRTTSHVDSRAKTLQVTRVGGELARLAIRAVETADAEFFAPAARREVLLAGLRRLDGSSEMKKT